MPVLSTAWDLKESTQFSGITWQRLPPAAVWQTAEEYAGRVCSLPSAPGSEGGCRPWWGTGRFATWHPQTLKTWWNVLKPAGQAHTGSWHLHIKTHSPAFSSGSLHRDEDLDLMPTDSVRLSSTGRTIWHKHKQKHDNAFRSFTCLSSSFIGLWFKHSQKQTEGGDTSG